MNAPAAFHAQHATIGSLIALLEPCDPAKRVAFDFCGFAPNGIHPRAPFGHLALGYASMIRDQWPTVEQLVRALYGAVHQTFHTPADGSFPGKSETPLWVGTATATTASRWSLGSTSTPGSISAPRTWRSSLERADKAHALGRCAREAEG